MKNKKIYWQILPLCLCVSMLGGCGANATSSNTTTASALVNATQEMTGGEVAAAFNPEDINLDWKNMEHATIKLEEGQTEIDRSGIYELTGSLQDGGITINIDKTKDDGTVYLVLNNAAIESKTSAPIYVKEAQKVVIFLENGTVNTMTQGSEVVENDSGEPNGAIFSKADLTIAGTGKLQVVSEYNDGITSKDDLIISGGTIQVSAVGDGMTGKDMIAVETAEITIDAGKDGMRSTNATDTAKGNITISGGTIHVTAENDAIQAEQIIQINGGTFDLTSGGGYPGQSVKTNDSFDGRLGTGGAGKIPPEGAAAAETTATETVMSTESETEESKKTIKAGAKLIINDGTFTLSSYEDALHSNGTVSINGGSFDIEAGDDAIHGDGVVLITSGEININNSYEGVEGSDIAIKAGTITLTSSNDGINVSSQSGTLTIDGGDIALKSGGDGVDSNGNIVINGGNIVIDTSLTGAGDTPMDYDGTCTVNGGTITDQNGTAIDYQNQQRGGGNGGRRMTGERPQRGKGGTTDESGS